MAVVTAFPTYDPAYLEHPSYTYMSLLVIDLSRLVIAFGAGTSAGPEVMSQFFQALFTASEWDAWTLPLSKTKQTNVLLLLRTVANAFHDDSPIAEGTWVFQVCAFRLHSHLS